jgi:N6-adenosine-specific RNA methylase IME4
VCASNAPGPLITQDLPAGRFCAILADPPWPYATYSAKGKGRSAEAHYDTMSIDAITALPVARWAAPGCVLFLWITKPSLLHAATILSIWGFDYITVGFTWIKARPDPAGILRFGYGLGHWTRGNPEMCLLATRCHPHRTHADVAELIIAPRREHSRKRDEIYERIERLVAWPYLELFASTASPHRDGWKRWIGKDRAPARRWPSDGYPGTPA